MSQLLMWATEDKPILNLGDIFTVKPRRKKEPKPVTPPYEEEQPTDIINHVYCPTCDKCVDGFNCGRSEKCPW